MGQLWKQNFGQSSKSRRTPNPHPNRGEKSLWVHCTEQGWGLLIQFSLFLVFLCFFLRLENTVHLLYSYIRYAIIHDDTIKCKHFPLYWPYVQGIHRRPVNSPHKGQWRGALMFALICASINGWINNGEAGDLRHHHTHYDVTVMSDRCPCSLDACGDTFHYECCSNIKDLSFGKKQKQKQTRHHKSKCISELGFSRVLPKVSQSR